ALGETLLRLRAAGRHDGEVVGVVELAVHRETKQAEKGALVLNNDRHRGGNHVGSVAADRDVDFVDIQKLGVDAGDKRGVRLVVIVDQLDRTSQQTTFCVDFFFPYLQGEQRGLAVGRQPPR